MSRRSRDRQGLILGAALVIVFAAGSLPYGSPHPWANLMLATLVCAWSAVAFLFRAHPGRPVFRAACVPCCAFVLLFAWSACQLTPGSAAWFGMESETGTLAVNRFASLRSLVPRIAAVLLMLAAARCFNRSTRLHRMALLLIGGGVLLALSGIPSVYDRSGDAGFQRMTGAFKSGIYFAGMLSLTACLTLGVLLDTTRKIVEDCGGLWHLVRHKSDVHQAWFVRWVALVLALLLQAAGLVMSASRGAILSFAVAVSLLLLVYLVRNRGTRTWGAVLGSALLLIAAGTGGAFAFTWERFSELAQPDSAMNLLSRIEIWKSSIQLFLQHPWGIGAGGFPDLSPALQPPLFPDRRWSHAHNDYLELLCETGWPGLLPLLLLGGWFLFAGLRIFKRGTAKHRWMIRGMWMGLLAGCLHLLTDSNLILRPAYLMLFATFTGLLTAALAILQQPAVNRDVRRSGWAGAAGMLLAIALLPLAAVLSYAAYLVEAGRISGGLVTRPPYFWLNAPPEDREAARIRLERAHRLAPWDATAPEALGLLQLRAFDETLQAGTSSYLMRFPGLAPASVRSGLLARHADEGRRAVGAALQELERARALAPHRLDLLAALARAHCTQQALSPSPEQLDAARKAMDRARAAGPRDITARLVLLEGHRDLLHAEPELLRAEALKEIRGALSLTRTRKDHIIQTAAQMGIGLEDLAALPDLGSDGLLHLYRLARRKGDGPTSLRLLDALHARATDRDPEWFRWREKGFPLPIEQFVVRERARWLLYEGNWEAYRELADARRDYAAWTAEEQLAGLGGNPISRRVQMKWMEEQHVIPLHLLPALVGMDQHAISGIRQQRISRLLFGNTGVPTDTKAWPFARQVRDWREQSTNDCETQLIDTALYFDQAAHADFLHAAGQAIETCPTPFPWAHRLQARMAAVLLELDRIDEAERATRSGLEHCPDDPDLLRLAARIGMEQDWGREAAAHLRDLSPDHQLGTAFLAGAVTCDGFTVSPDAHPDSSNCELILYYRFFGTVPPDLMVHLSLHDASRQRIHLVSTMFKQVQPVRFGFGNPQMGCVIPVRLEIPATARAAVTMRVSLMSPGNRRRIASEEGLEFFETRAWAAGLPPLKRTEPEKEEEGLLILF